MGFWKKVDEELNYLGKSRKEIAQEADFNVSYIAKGIARNGIPTADLAVRIAHCLDVSVEYLLDIPESKKEKTKKSPDTKKPADQKSKVTKLLKYESVINDLDSLPDDKKKPIIQFIKIMKQASQHSVQ